MIRFLFRIDPATGKLCKGTPSGVNPSALKCRDQCVHPATGHQDGYLAVSGGASWVRMRNLAHELLSNNVGSGPLGNELHCAFLLLRVTVPFAQIKKTAARTTAF